MPEGPFFEEDEPFTIQLEDEPMGTELAVYAKQVGATLLPDNERYTNRLGIRSSSSTRLYVVAQSRRTGQWSCSCPGWISHRHCKHLQVMLPGLRLLAAAS
jgi:hypothetical protein